MTLPHSQSAAMRVDGAGTYVLSLAPRSLLVLTTRGLAN
jgi:hypothetical protein